MIKLFFILTGLLILFVFYRLIFTASSTNRFVGSTDDMSRYVEGLVTSKDEYAFLVVTIAGTENFIQLTGSKDTVQLNYPLITDHQKSNEKAFIRVYKSFDMEYELSSGSGGEAFLDSNIKGSAAEIAAVLNKVIVSVFNVTEGAELQYEIGGFDVADS